MRESFKNEVREYFSKITKKFHTCK
ncbi:Protein of unknown function [Pyronema omphalodes CBS 100304]|uniref:Uncharacterized protein n=1 Tax=Pyronema omphalodes (strain CBS 100304) TaxID=1076935 RepID=U4LH28_PYROM|nr:Protein of unknown function [Pyronema omphalodes CBS 100304]